MKSILALLLLGVFAATSFAEEVLYLRGKPLIGSAVVNRAGERMGDVADLILGTSGRVEYIVVQTTSGIIETVDGVYPRARGEDAGNIGAVEMIAIPWRTATARATGHELVVDISKDKFNYAPAFRDWADFEWTGEQQERARAYFGK
jgi:sporulation protein YlmC with PRC-barrel domain